MEVKDGEGAGGEGAVEEAEGHCWGCWGLRDVRGDLVG